MVTAEGSRGLQPNGFKDWRWLSAVEWCRPLPLPPCVEQPAVEDNISFAELAFQYHGHLKMELFRRLEGPIPQHAGATAAETPTHFAKRRGVRQEGFAPGRCGLPQHSKTLPRIL
jgi:hypothetical protein